MTTKFGRLVNGTVSSVYSDKLKFNTKHPRYFYLALVNVDRELCLSEWRSVCQGSLVNVTVDVRSTRDRPADGVPPGRCVRKHKRRTQRQHSEVPALPHSPACRCT